jgi:hypothetical protein
MDGRIEEILDNNENLQTLIMSPEWAHYTRATLLERALRMCIALGANGPEARKYLEIDKPLAEFA